MGLMGGLKWVMKAWVTKIEGLCMLLIVDVRESEPKRGGGIRRIMMVVMVSF